MRVNGINNYQQNKQNFGIGHPVSSDALGLPYSLTNKLLKLKSTTKVKSAFENFERLCYINEDPFKRLSRVTERWEFENRVWMAENKIYENRKSWLAHKNFVARLNKEHLSIPRKILLKFFESLKEANDNLREKLRVDLDEK